MLGVPDQPIRHRPSIMPLLCSAARETPRTFVSKIFCFRPPRNCRVSFVINKWPGGAWLARHHVEYRVSFDS